MRPTSPQVTALLAVLYSRHGDGVIARDDIEQAVRALPNGSRIGRSHLDDMVEAALTWMRVAGANGYTLSEASLAMIGFAIDNDLALSPEEDAQLVELLRNRAHDGALPSDELASVTRRFLEDVLAEADIPDELLQAIVSTYVQRGTLTMSEDGGRYTISL
jgi:Ca2+-binding EF-hand superfamily protein